MSSGRFRISVSTVPAFFRRSASFSLSSAQLVIASNNALIAQTNILFFMTVSYNGYSCGNLCLGYGWFFVDALMVMVLAVIYLSLTHALPLGESVGTMAAIQT